MKKSAFIFLLLSVLTLSVMQSQTLSARFAYSSYMKYPQSPYIEAYFFFNGHDVVLQKQQNENYRAAVDITFIVYKNDTIVDVTKRKLLGPEVTDSTKKDYSFIDLQRFYLNNGIYTLEVLLVDAAKPIDTIRSVEKILINYNLGSISISEILLAVDIKPTTKENLLSKNGYDIEPFFSSYISEDMKKLSYYVEFYNVASVLGNAKPFLAYSSLESYETGVKLSDYQLYSKDKAQTTNILGSNFDISQLPTGNYNLKVEVLDSNGNTLIYKKVPFYRNNPEVANNVDSILRKQYSFAQSITNDSLLTFYIQSLAPIASEVEQSFITKECKTASLSEKQDFFDGFWFLRNSKNPKGEWTQYYQSLLVVESKFSVPNKPGFKTDRGRVFLKYGPPSRIIDEKFKTSPGVRSHERAAYLPYQIWRYDQLQGINGRNVFLFWAPQSSSKEYYLLNSNVPGETTEMFWETRLSRGGIPEGEEGEAGQQFRRGY